VLHKAPQFLLPFLCTTHINTSVNLGHQAALTLTDYTGYTAFRSTGVTHRASFE